MKYCPKCGREAQDEDRFCRNCGYDFETLKEDEGATYEVRKTQTRPAVSIEYRNIAICILLSLVTCGIYGLYWQYRLTEDLNDLYPDDYTTSGGMAVVLTFVTCGIYGFYWAYKMGRKVSHGDSSGSILYVLLYLFIGIVCYALLQSEVNRLAGK